MILYGTETGGTWKFVSFEIFCLNGRCSHLALFSFYQRQGLYDKIEDRIQLQFNSGLLQTFQRQILEKQKNTENFVHKQKEKLG